MNQNDNKILDLMSIIKKRREELNGYKKPAMRTNGVLHLGANTINLNTLHKVGDVNFLLCAFDALLASAERQKIDPQTIKISGYTAGEWLCDLDDRRAYIEHKNAEEELKEYEAKLDAMLSSDKKTELEIGAIAKALGVDSQSA